MSDQLLADIARDGRSRVRVTLSERKGIATADVRTFATDRSGALVPTHAGVPIRPFQIRQVIEALAAAEAKFVADGLLKPRGDRK